MVKFKHLNVSVRGPRHILENLPNQDSSSIKVLPVGLVIVVCDGMGSRLKADVGSKLACRAVIKILAKLDFDTEDRLVVKKVYQYWINSLGSIHPKQAVTTCLFAWVSHSGRVRTFQLGDGLIVSPVEKVMNKISSEKNTFGNETTGLGISTKFSDWEINQYSLCSGDYIALITDGISEDIVSGMEMRFVQSIIENTLTKSSRLAKTWLKKELHNWATPNHLDDKTIALLELN